MAKKTNASSKEKDTLPKGYETIDLLTGEVINPIREVAIQKQKDELEDTVISVMAREQAFMDVINAICNMPLTPHDKLKGNKYPVRYRYSDIKPSAKEMSYFMVLQGFSHLYPRQAQMLNSNYINAINATDIIYDFVCRKYGTRPAWDLKKSMMPMSSKAPTTMKYTDESGNTKSMEISFDAIREFCIHRGWSLTDYHEAIDIYGSEKVEDVLCNFHIKRNELKNASGKVIAKGKKVDYDNDFDGNVKPNMGAVMNAIAQTAVEMASEEQQIQQTATQPIVQEPQPGVQPIMAQPMVQPVVQQKLTPQKRSKSKKKKQESSDQSTTEQFALFGSNEPQQPANPPVNSVKTPVQPTVIVESNALFDDSINGRVLKTEADMQKQMKPMMTPIIEAPIKKEEPVKRKKLERVVPLTDDIELSFVPTDLKITQNIIL